MQIEFNNEDNVRRIMETENSDGSINDNSNATVDSQLERAGVTSPRDLMKHLKRCHSNGNSPVKKSKARKLKENQEDLQTLDDTLLDYNDDIETELSGADLEIDERIGEASDSSENSMECETVVEVKEIGKNSDRANSSKKPAFKIEDFENNDDVKSYVGMLVARELQNRLGDTNNQNNDQANDNQQITANVVKGLAKQLIGPGKADGKKSNFSNTVGIANNNICGMNESNGLHAV